MTFTEFLAARRIYELECQRDERTFARDHSFEEWLAVQTMTPPRQFDYCPRCRAETAYRDKGGLSLECSKCNWVAVEVEWVAAAVKN